MISILTEVSFVICYTFHIIIILIWEFFKPVFADGFPLEFEWRQDYSSLQDPSLYSGRSQQCFSLEGLLSFSYFQILLSLYHIIW